MINNYIPVLVNNCIHMLATSMFKSFFCKILLPTILLLFSCKNEETVERDSLEFKSGTDWESRGLFGEVKSATVSKATFVDTDRKKTREPSITFREIFTDFGSLEKTESYDNFGGLIQTTTNEFDENERLIKSNHYANFRPSKTVTIIEYDTLSNITVWNMMVNDSLEYKAIEKSDPNGELIEKVSIHNNDTIVSKATIEYDENDRIILKKVISTNQYDNEFFKYKYDESGNIIESVTGNDGMKFKSISKYSDNHMILDSLFVISADNKEHLSEITTYDKFFNPINQKIFEKSELNRELKNIYEMDKKGNWIKRTVYMKEHFADSKIFKQAYVEIREIEYWK